jgi:hypothetical protein
MRSPAILMPFIAHRIYQWTPALIDASWGLQTVPHGMAYSLCSSLLCSRCGLLFLDIRFSDGEMQRLYVNYRDEAYTALRDHYEPGYRARNEGLLQGVNYMQEIEDFLSPHLPDTVRVLDWGGDTGVNTPFKSGAGNTVHIYDISGQETAGQLRKVSLQTARQHVYDLVVCSNVLEHVPYPRQLIADILELMSPTTVLYIEVPFEKLVRDYSDPMQLLQHKRHWHEHINFFSKASIEALISEMGLKLLQIRELDVEIVGGSYTLFQIALRVR